MSDFAGWYSFTRPARPDGSSLEDTALLGPGDVAAPNMAFHPSLTATHPATEKPDSVYEEIHAEFDKQSEEFQASAAQQVQDMRDLRLGALSHSDPEANNPGANDLARMFPSSMSAKAKQILLRFND